jgi:hypothetical protein
MHGPAPLSGVRTCGGHGRGERNAHASHVQRRAGRARMVSGRSCLKAAPSCSVCGLKGLQTQGARSPPVRVQVRWSWGWATAVRAVLVLPL